MVLHKLLLNPSNPFTLLNPALRSYDVGLS